MKTKRWWAIGFPARKPPYHILTGWSTDRTKCTAAIRRSSVANGRGVTWYYIDSPTKPKNAALATEGGAV